MHYDDKYSNHRSRCQRLCFKAFDERLQPVRLQRQRERKERLNSLPDCVAISGDIAVHGSNS